jgi:hypothetical protein
LTIAQFSAGRKRNTVICIGDTPGDADAQAFSSRGYMVVGLANAELMDLQKLADVDSVVISQDPNKPSRIRPALERLARNLLACDCRIYVRVATSQQLQDVGRDIVVNAIHDLELPGAGLSSTEQAKLPAAQQESEGNPFAPFVYVCDVAVKWNDIAKLIADNPSGRTPNFDLKVDVIDANGSVMYFTHEKTLLLRRAFADCASVRLHEVIGGLSGVSVFRAYVELESGLLGRWPIVYFVKIGSRRKIAIEYNKYQGHALMYVPSHLGPRLSLERCALGAADGILVGDFMDQAETFRDCARSGRAVRSISNLFNHTLAAWRNAAVVNSVLAIPQLLGYLFPVDIPKGREPLIRGCGAKLTLQEVRTLFESCASRPVLVGTIHCDLNATNVLARFGDAIVIDFEQLADGKPLVYDPASVEASLLVDGFANDPRDTDEWLLSIVRLYERRDMFGWIAPCRPDDPSAWFFDCVRQIRSYAHHLELVEGQYATALALALLKKSCNPNGFDIFAERRRASAFLLAENLLQSITA